MNCFHRTLNIHRRLQFHVIKRERARLQIFVDSAFQIHQIFARRLEPGQHEFFLHLDERYAGIGRSVAAAEDFQGFLVGLVVLAVMDQNYAARAMRAGIGGLAVELRVIGIDLACKHTGGIVFLRLVAQDQHQFAFDIESGVVVIVVLGRGNAIAGEYHAARNLPAGREIERYEVAVHLQCAASPGGGDFETVSGSGFGAGGDFKRLQVIEAGNWFQAVRPVFTGNIVCRFFEFRRPAGPALHLRRGQNLDVGNKPVYGKFGRG